MEFTPEWIWAIVSCGATMALCIVIHMRVLVDEAVAVISLMLFAVWGAAAGVLTFKSPYGNPGNSYYAIWMGFVARPVRWNRGCNGRLWLRCSRLQRSCGKDLGFVSRARKREFGHQGSRRQGPPGWPHWLCLWLMCFAAELANESLAVRAVVGRVLQDGLAGSACGSCALFPASPLRAFGDELGVRAPVGFGDPAGFAADGNDENIAKLTSWQIIGMCLQEGLAGSAGGACALYKACLPAGVWP